MILQREHCVCSASREPEEKEGGVDEDTEKEGKKERKKKRERRGGEGGIRGNHIAPKSALVSFSITV